MNSMTLAIRLSIVGCWMPAAALAQGTQWQTNDMQGMFTGASVGIISNSSAADGAVLIRSPGVVNGPPGEWSEARFGAVSYEHPDYSKAGLLFGIKKLVNGAPLTTTLGFGGISTGGDVCPPINALGELQLLSSWYFLSVTVGARPFSTGVPGSVLSNLANPTQSILSYYAEGSTGINSNLIDSTVAEQTSAQLLGPSTPANFDVSGIDWGMGAISVDPYGRRSLAFAPVRDKFYFTLTAAWLNANPQFVAAATAFVLNPATIYVMQWDWDNVLGGWAWTVPTIAVAADDLLGVYDHAGEEIDALSVYARAGTYPVMRVVFSMTRSAYPPNQPPGYQLLGYDLANSSPAMPLKTISGILVAENLGLIITGGPTEVDNVTGTCGGDPEGGVLDSVVGWAMASLGAGSGQTLGLSVYRSITISDSGDELDSVNLQVSGIKLAQSLNGQVRYQVGIPTPEGLSGFTGKPYSWFPLGAVNVTPGSTTASFEIPGNLGDLGPVSISATLHTGSSATVLRSSWITVLDY